MKKVFGFALFWFAAGMIVMMLLSDVLWGTVIAITGIVLAYCLSADKKRTLSEQTDKVLYTVSY